VHIPIEWHLEEALSQKTAEGAITPVAQWQITLTFLSKLIYYTTVDCCPQHKQTTILETGLHHLFFQRAQWLVLFKTCVFWSWWPIFPSIDIRLATLMSSSQPLEFLSLSMITTIDLMPIHVMGLWQWFLAAVHRNCPDSTKSPKVAKRVPTQSLQVVKQVRTLQGTVPAFLKDIYSWSMMPTFFTSHFFIHHGWCLTLNTNICHNNQISMTALNCSSNNLSACLLKITAAPFNCPKMPRRRFVLDGTTQAIVTDWSSPK